MCFADVYDFDPADHIFLGNSQGATNVYVFDSVRLSMKRAVGSEIEKYYSKAIYSFKTSLLLAKELLVVSLVP